MATQSLVNAQLLYQISPIILTDGIAASTTGNMQSLMMLLAPSLTFGQPTQSSNLLDNAFGSFTVIPGGTLNAQTIPKYPLADMTLAANAIVRDPIQVSLMWDIPMRGVNAWANRLSTMQNLKGLLDQHNNAGGRYIILTPSYYYENCIFVALTDNSRGTQPIPQSAWRFDFERPMVVTVPDATGAQSLLMSRITAGLKTPGTWSYPAAGGSGGQPNLSPGPNTAAPLAPAVGAPLALPGATPASPVGTVVPSTVGMGLH